MSLVIPGIRSVNQNKVALMAVLEPERSLAEVFLEQLPLWLITNEKGVSKTLSILEKAPPKGDVFFGVGGLYSLDMASRRRGIKQIYLFDCSLKVAAFWSHILPILRTHPRRFEALAEMNRVIEENPDWFSTRKGPCALQTHSNQLIRWVESGHSFLSEDRFYQKIHDLARRAQIVFQRADLSDPDSSNAIYKYFLNKTVDTFYLSNISTCLPKKSEREVVRVLMERVRWAHGAYLVLVNGESFEQWVIGEMSFEAPFKIAVLAAAVFVVASTVFYQIL